MKTDEHIVLRRESGNVAYHGRGVALLARELVGPAPARDISPVTIIRTRYGGVYEGGKWAAFNLDPEDAPEDAMGCDPECEAWWRAPTVPVGVGATPDEALAALAAKLSEPGDRVVVVPADREPMGR